MRQFDLFPDPEPPLAQPSGPRKKSARFAPPKARRKVANAATQPSASTPAKKVVATPTPAAPDGPVVLSVSQLTDVVKELLEGAFPAVDVTGEITNFSRAHSGHCYFTLKDDRAQVRAVMWRSAAARLRFDLHDGLEVVCHGAIEVYAARGTYQLVVDRLVPRGMGALELALRQLHAKLAAEGLFAPERKRPLRRFPRRIAVVTSPTGAAIKDFLEVLRRRWRGTDVWIIPARVQGERAGVEIAAGIALANRLANDIDTLVVCRGGGSTEDLWAFNEERVVRAIAASQVPVVSAVGHEIDVTLSDLVADVRALTPSEAAELVVPSVDEMRGLIRQLAGRLRAGLSRRAALARTRLAALAGSRVLRRPLERIHDLSRRLDELDTRAFKAQRRRLDLARHRVERLGGKLESLSPLQVLARGYSLTERADDGHLVRDARTLKMGDRLRTRLARGSVTSRVEELDDAARAGDAG
ncbi:MAG: exodeoxyribonuclease VII large subunit [Pirellulales bacterium]|nr:exodeoxyribonuclease VII large subunit [Pirellulales bacterium]